MTRPHVRPGVVHFVPDEVEYTAHVAASRNGIKWRHGLGTSGTYEGLSDTDQMHFDNALAEYAVTRVIGGEVDERVFVAGHTDGNIILPGGFGRGRACFRNERGRDFCLKDTNPKHFYGDFGFLVYPYQSYLGPGVSLEVVAWISRAEFLEKAHVERLKAERLVVRRSEMHRMSEPLRHYAPPVEQPSLI